jgi:asparagine synthase (glutamine-hydrolysing)
MDSDLIEFALSIERKLKINQDIYIDWMNSLHPDTTRYIWERTGFRPDKKWKTNFSRYTNKINKEFYLFFNRGDKLSMNPLDFWFQTNKSIQEFYTDFFENNIALVSPNQELYTDIKSLFKKGNLTEKALVLTLLELIKKLKLHV